MSSSATTRGCCAGYRHQDHRARRGAHRPASRSSRTSSSCSAPGCTPRHVAAPRPGQRHHARSTSATRWPRRDRQPRSAAGSARSASMTDTAARQRPLSRAARRSSLAELIERAGAADPRRPQVPRARRRGRTACSTALAARRQVLRHRRRRGSSTTSRCTSTPRTWPATASPRTAGGAGSRSGPAPTWTPAQCWLEVKTRGTARAAPSRSGCRTTCDDRAHARAPGAAFVDGVLGARTAIRGTRPARPRARRWSRGYRRTHAASCRTTASRVTVDTDLSLATTDAPPAAPAGPRGRRDEDRLDRVRAPTACSGAHGYRPQRISKYATGLAALRPDLPAARWRRTLHRHCCPAHRLADRPASPTHVADQPSHRA